MRSQPRSNNFDPGCKQRRSLSTQAFSHFDSGLYAVWNIQGHVLIQVTHAGGLNAVVSGLFFGEGGDPVMPPPSGGTDPGGNGTPFIKTYGFYNPRLRNDGYGVFAAIIGVVYQEYNGFWHTIAPPNYAYSPPNFK